MATAADATSIGLGARLAAWLVAAATVIVIIGASVAPFLSPAFVRFEQDRAGAGALTGFDPAELDAVTGALLGDLVLFRGDFDATVAGEPVLSERERTHMLEVRGVFGGLWLLVAGALAGLLVAARRAGGGEPRRALWRAVASGARGLAIAVAVLGAFVVLAFEAAFEVFHRLFFSSGTYTFDPRTDRLVQLFPEWFWAETAIAVAIVVMAAAILTAWQADRRAAAPRASAVLEPSRANP